MFACQWSSWFAQSLQGQCQSIKWRPGGKYLLQCRTRTCSYRNWLKAEILHFILDPVNDIKAEEIIAISFYSYLVNVDATSFILLLHWAPEVFPLFLDLILSLLDGFQWLTQPVVSISTNLTVTVTLEGELVMGPLVLSLGASNKRFIHHVFVLKEGEVHWVWCITDVIFCVLLTLLVTNLLYVGLVPVVDLFSHLVFAFVLRLLRTDSFVSLAFFESLKNMFYVEPTVGTKRGSCLGLFWKQIDILLAHWANALCAVAAKWVKVRVNDCARCIFRLN